MQLKGLRANKRDRFPLCRSACLTDPPFPLQGPLSIVELSVAVPRFHSMGSGVPLRIKVLAEPKTFLPSVLAFLGS